MVRKSKRMCPFFNSATYQGPPLCWAPGTELWMRQRGPCSHQTYTLVRAERKKKMYLFARAAVTEYHKLGALNNRNVLSHSSGARSPRSRCQQGGFLWGLWGKGSVPGFSPWLVDGHLHTVFPLCRSISKLPLFKRTQVILDSYPP